MEKWILKFTRFFERFAVSILLLALVVSVFHAMLGFVYMLVAHIRNAWVGAFHQINKDMLHELYSSFLLLLIGLELINTTKIYLQKNVVHAEVVLLVALIAMARHVIDMNFEEYQPVTIVGIGILIVALSGGYWLFTRSMVLKRKNNLENLPED